MKQLSIRWRLTLWYGAVLTAMLCAFSVAVFFMLHQHLQARTDMELDEELHELGAEVQFARDEADLQKQLARRFAHHETFDFQVSTIGRQSVFRSERLKESALPIPDGLDVRKGSVRKTQFVPGLGEYRVASRIVETPRASFVIQTIASLAPSGRELRDLVLMLLAVGPLGIAGGLVGGYVLARQALAPVDRMTATADLITAEQLDQRIEVLNPDDELGRLARTLNRMFDRLHASIEEMRRFTADAAHELRTPLAVLRTECEVALRVPRSAELYREVVEVTLAETVRLTQLADQLMLLCRHDSGLEKSHADEVRLDAVVQDVIDQVRNRAEQKGVTLEAGGLEPWTVRGDDVRLSQIFFNLLDNAVKYTPHEGRIEIRGETRGNRVRLTVEDTGIGIPAEHLPHIFKRFYRVDKSRNRDLGGAGLGLAICKSIVETHGGRMDVESSVGHGTQAVVELPLAGSPSDASSHEEATSSLPAV